jgi:phage-related protein
MIEFGANLGMPHTKSISSGLFELRVKSQEGLARVFFCTHVNKRIFMLHGYKKKTQRVPKKERVKAERRMKEVIQNEA